jgi:hypothetical protein
MLTTKFGNEIIKAAEDVLSLGYRAYNKNLYGEVLENVVKEFDVLSPRKYYAGQGKKQPDYCAITQSIILDRAFRNFDGSVNTFRTASAGEFLSKGKQRGLRVDKNPAVGCLFVQPRNGGSGYHIGLVYKLLGNKFRTIEGNTYSSSSYILQKDGCAIKLGPNEYGILTRLRNVKPEMQFIHTEEMFSKETSTYPDSPQYLAESDVLCEIMDEDVPATEGDFTGELAAPNISQTSLSFIEKYKTELILGGGIIGIIILGLISRNK